MAANSRVALVIGNASYQSAVSLRNPLNDADLVAEGLRLAGFENPIVEKNLSYAHMRDTFRKFSAAANKADMAVVYYAGHGIEVNGQNYMIPVDAKLE